MRSAPLSATFSWLPGNAENSSGFLQSFALVFMTAILLCCVHHGLVQLSGLLVPFVLSGFIVSAVEPSVEIVFRLITARVPPYRWCCCCCVRRWRRWKSHKGKRSGGAVDENDWSARRSSSSRLVQAREYVRRQSALASEPNAPLLDVQQAAKLLSSSSETSSAASFEQRAWDYFGNRSDDDPTQMLLEPTEVSWRQTLEEFGDVAGRIVAVSLALCGMAFVVFAFITLLVRGAMHMREGLGAYRLGVQRLVTQMDSMTNSISSSLKLGSSVDQRAKEINNFMFRKMQDMVESLVNYIVTGVSVGVSSIMLIFLYVMFWLMKPLPFSGQGVGYLVRNYIWKKTLVSFLYGLWVSLLFFALGNDLAIFFGMVSFFLNYVPEVGAVISILVPIPVIMLDGRLESPLRTAAIAVVGQLFLKFLFNNILEVKLVTEDSEMNIHPVWVVLGLNYFNFVWGTTGMLLSVPLLAILKSTVLSILEREHENNVLAPSWAELVLNCMEGRPGKGSSKLARNKKSKSSTPTYDGGTLSSLAQPALSPRDKPSTLAETEAKAPDEPDLETSPAPRSTEPDLETAPAALSTQHEPPA